MAGETSLKFGTSGLRGLAAELNGLPALVYSRAFAEVLKADGSVSQRQRRVLIGRDLRESSESIARICCSAVQQAGLTPVDCGPLPTPALACFGLRFGMPSIMVTGSHIPEDRNGLKFYRANGEIDKHDESLILSRVAEMAAGMRTIPAVDAIRGVAPEIDPLMFYGDRYLSAFEPHALDGLTIGVYQHSSVARDLLPAILEGLGARTITLGRADRFIPVDTEALREEDKLLARKWAGEFQLDAIVSTDGDSDRPLIADQDGFYLRGDLIGAITAKQLGSEAVVTPVTSNSALEKSNFFKQVIRTKVGSPYVIEGMAEAIRSGARSVIGFEANGGVLLGTTAKRGDKELLALPTRDAMLPILCTLSEITRTGRSLRDISSDFGFNAAASDRLKNIESEKTQQFLRRLHAEPTFLQAIFASRGGVADINAQDGLRIALHNGEIVHFRASGNAPELRSYVEARTDAEAGRLLSWSLNLASSYVS